MGPTLGLGASSTTAGPTLSCLTPRSSPQNFFFLQNYVQILRYTCVSGKAFQNLKEQSVVSKCDRHTSGSSTVSWKYNDANALPDCVREYFARKFDFFLLCSFPAYCTTEFPNIPDHASVSLAQSTNISGQVKIPQLLWQEYHKKQQIKTLFCHVKGCHDKM